MCGESISCPDNSNDLGAPVLCMCVATPKSHQLHFSDRSQLLDFLPFSFRLHTSGSWYYWVSLLFNIHLSETSG